jgi:HEAT repeat protein
MEGVMSKTCKKCNETIDDFYITCPRCGRLYLGGDMQIGALFIGTVTLLPAILIRPHIEADFWRIVVLVLRWIFGIVGAFCYSIILIPGIFHAITNPIPYFLSKRKIEGLKKYVTSKSDVKRNAAIHALNEIGSEEAVQALLVSLKEAENKHEIIKSLGEIGDRRAVAPLLELLDGEDDWGTLTTVEALGKIGDVQVVDPLLAILNKTSDNTLKRYIIEALGDLGDKRAVDSIISHLDTKNDWIKKEAISALVKIGDDRAVRPIAALLYNHKVKEEAAEALRKMGRMGNQTLEAWEKKDREKSELKERQRREQEEQEEKLRMQREQERKDREQHVLETPSTVDQLAILENAYLVRQDDELERKVNASLDRIAASGKEGINMLMQRLQQDMKLNGKRLEVHFSGDLAWNEWLKKRTIVRALARAHATTAIPYLLELCGATSSVQQFYEILQPACARALGELGDPRVVATLQGYLHGSEVSNETKRAIGEALEKLEGHPVLDPALIVAKADKMSKRNQGDEVLLTLSQLDAGLFDSLNDMQKYYVWYMRGMVYKFKGDKRKAIECFETSLKYFNGPTAVSHIELRELRLS